MTVETMVGGTAALGRTHFLSLGFDSLTQEAVLAWLIERGPDSVFAYVVTPNVDHMVRLEQEADPRIRAAYQQADLCLCDSRILAGLARTAGIQLTVVPGSDLTPGALARAFVAGDRLCLIGGTPGMGAALAKRYPKLEISEYIPPMGLRHDPVARAAAIDFIAANGPRAVLLAVGSPQQELLALEMRESGRIRGTALCVGASVDFLIGKQTRAPRLLQKAHLEWAWRLASDPMRFWRRYLIDGPAIFGIVWRWTRRRH